MFYYFVKFMLANTKKAEEINLSERVHVQKFEAAKKYFNAAGKDARVYKKILTQNITSSYIEITFECAKQLDNPTMYFRSYSKFLIDTYGLDWTNASGNFLKGVEAKEITPDKLFQSDENPEITDIEMFKQLLDLCFEKRIETAEDKKNRKRTISKIKSLLKEYQAI